ncbi:MAG: HAMP domain-containing histidine kinase [Candidatus Krumholzibacteriota bacterium]|nr:HAMP domain-containing histidine kinase [Candidatus Krumholzibacteriota bacterium]
MASVTKTKQIDQYEKIILNTTREVESLRGELSRYKGIFDSARLVIGHEFVKPLTSINGYVELLESKLMGKAGNDESRYFAQIKQAVRQLEELVESFVQMLRFDSWTEQREGFEEIDLYELVGEISGAYGSFPGRVINRIDRSLPKICQKKKYLRIVLDNLISNAVKHGGGSRPAYVRASIKKDRRKISGERQLVVEVVDNGKGLPREELEEIFNPFYRGEGGDQISGLGLGLTLVKNIVSIMMGDIQIKSDPGKGTTATFRVPLPAEKKDPGERIG